MPDALPIRESRDSSADSLDRLIEARAWLNEFVRPHWDSVNHFATATGFARSKTSSLQPRAQHSELPQVTTRLGIKEQLSGITTGFTCFESLAAAFPRPKEEETRRDRERFESFVRRCVNRPDDWKSEGAADRYCVVRGLGGMVNRPGWESVDGASTDAIVAHLNEIWKGIKPEPHMRGVYEYAPGVQNKKNPGKADRYPPNAFLTYWAMQARKQLVKPARENRDEIAESWLAAHLGRELALAQLGRGGADPQQLLWAVCGLVIGRVEPLAERVDGTVDLVEAGLEAFFAQQRADGTWDTGRPLFHYLKAGNAYCYVYETMAEMLTLALGTHQASGELRALLRPYLAQLLVAARHLDRSKRPLDEDGWRFGWSSGHAAHRPQPESWATASAYRYLQGLRRFVGMEVSKQAAQLLKARAAQGNLQVLEERGQTWADGDSEAAGAVLKRLFVDRASHVPVDNEPDAKIFDKTMARSAILFGPPGTGKTTLADAVAGALGWKFIEITPADFLNEGVEFVSARADKIFSLLMELDHTVILLDEIDELIRERNDGNSDALSRFFTTTMLPRLARLWEQARVIFFVNTNAMSHVDTAVQRSQRFDAAIFVMPPGFEAKAKLLQGLLPKEITKATVDKIIQVYEETDASGSKGKSSRPPEPHKIDKADPRMAWLPFLRFDQVEGLKSAAKAKLEGESSITDEWFLAQLEARGLSTLRTDWRDHDGEGTDPEYSLMDMVRRYSRERVLARRDPQRDPEGPPEFAMADLV